MNSREQKQGNGNDAAFSPSERCDFISGFLGFSSAAGIHGGTGRSGKQNLRTDANSLKVPQISSIPRISLSAIRCVRSGTRLGFAIGPNSEPSAAACRRNGRPTSPILAGIELGPVRTILPRTRRFPQRSPREVWDVSKPVSEAVRRQPSDDQSSGKWHSQSNGHCCSRPRFRTRCRSGQNDPHD